MKKIKSTLYLKNNSNVSPEKAKITSAFSKILVMPANTMKANNKIRTLIKNQNGICFKMLSVFFIFITPQYIHEKKERYNNKTTLLRPIDTPIQC